MKTYFSKNVSADLRDVIVELLSKVPNMTTYFETEMEIRLENPSKKISKQLAEYGFEVKK